MRQSPERVALLRRVESIHEQLHALADGQPLSRWMAPTGLIFDFNSVLADAKKTELGRDIERLTCKPRGRGTGVADDVLAMELNRRLELLRLELDPDGHYRVENLVSQVAEEIRKTHFLWPKKHVILSAAVLFVAVLTALGFGWRELSNRLIENSGVRDIRRQAEEELRAIEAMRATAEDLDADGQAHAIED